MGQTIIPGMGIEKAKALYADLTDRRTSYTVSDIVRAENLAFAIQKAKRKNLWTLPPKLPAARAPQKWTAVPTLSTLLEYVGTENYSTAVRLQAQMTLRGIPE